MYTYSLNFVSKHVAKVQRCDYLPLQKVVGAAAHNDEANCAGGVSAVVTHAVLQWRVYLLLQVDI